MNYCENEEPCVRTYITSIRIELGSPGCSGNDDEIYINKGAQCELTRLLLKQI